MRQIDKNSEEGNQKLGMRMKRDREKRERGLKKEIIFFHSCLFSTYNFPILYYYSYIQIQIVQISPLR